MHLSFPPKEGRLLRLSRAFSATSTGRSGMGTEGRWVGTERLILDPACLICDMRPVLKPRCDGVGKPLKKTQVRRHRG
jgi:hypothetical protein